MYARRISIHSFCVFILQKRHLWAELVIVKGGISLKIDLHCHTKQVKLGDGPGRNVSLEQFRQKIIDANVKIVAITNHNAFDYDQYVLLKGAVAGECAVWPGVEIDILGRNGGKNHLIIESNPENA